MKNIRNIAIIAHVDHGKTTLVDKILHHCQLFRENESKGELILDNNDLERERGITILSKNVSVPYKGNKINIIDTPGHADFGGEVERVLNMADGVLLLVDAFEGPMPQTRFVLQKAIDLKLKPIVVINKVDKENCTPEEVYEAVFDLMFELGAEEWQLDFPVLYGSAKHNWMSEDYQVQTDSVESLLDAVIKPIPSPKVEDGTKQMLITSLDYSSFTGRIAIGRLHRGVLKASDAVSLVKRDGSIVKSKIKELLVFDGLGRKKVEEVVAGDLCAIVGLDDFEIGDTVADIESPEGLPTIAIDEPTMSMLFTINDSPFFGKEGKFVTSRHIKDRLEKELERNLAMARFRSNSFSKRSLMWRDVTNFPSFPKKGESLIVNNILIVGSSIAMVGSPSGDSISATVSPISKSSNPTMAHKSPATTSSTFFLPSPSKTSNSLILDFTIEPSLLTNETASDAFSTPRCKRPMAIRPVNEE